MSQRELQVIDYLTEPCSALPYEPVWRQMQAFTRARTPDTPDQLWLLEHSPVYTLGQAGMPEHILNTQGIPIVRSDRGGQVTYHGPGQIMFYFLGDLRALDIGVRVLVETMEQAVIDVLTELGIDARGDRDAPGVYVADEKIAALGLRVSRGCCYHGLSFNYAPELAPFLGINPCGYENLSVTKLSNLMTAAPPKQAVAERVVARLRDRLAYGSCVQRRAAWCETGLGQ